MRKLLARFLNPTVIVCLLAAVALAAQIQSPGQAVAVNQPPQFPQAVGYVNDFAGKLSPAVKQQLEARLTAFMTRSGVDFVVVTMRLESLQGRAIEAYARALASQWGIGRGPKKLGVLLLIAIGSPDESNVYHGATRLAVSPNLQAYLSNELAAQLIQPMRADFQAGRFDQAVTTGAQSVMATLAEKLHVTLNNTNATPVDSTSPPPQIDSVQSSKWSWWSWLSSIFMPLSFLTFIGLIIIRIIKSLESGGSWQSGYGSNDETRAGLPSLLHNPANPDHYHNQVSHWSSTDSTWSQDSSNTSSSWSSDTSSASNSWTSSDAGSSSSDFGSSSSGDFGGGGASDSW